MPLPAPRWGAVESVYAHGRAAGTEVAYGAARRSNCTRKCCLSTSSTSSSLQSARAARQSALLLGVGFRLWDVDCRVQTAGCRPEAAGFVILTSHTLALRHRSAFRNCPPPQLIACAVSAPSCASLLPTPRASFTPYTSRKAWTLSRARRAGDAQRGHRAGRRHLRHQVCQPLVSAPVPHYKSSYERVGMMLASMLCDRHLGVRTEARVWWYQPDGV
eukprot:171730-Rhodomonas_salina.1